VLNDLNEEEVYEQVQKFMDAPSPPVQSEFRAALSSQSASNSELKTSLDGYADMVNQVLVDHHEQRGAARVMKWVTGTLLTAGALWVGISSIPPG
jgi:hypothetical protein